MTKLKLRFILVGVFGFVLLLSVRINFTDSYQIAVENPSTIQMAYLSDFGQGTSPACGCFEKIRDIRGLSTFASSVAIGRSRINSDLTTSPGLFIQSGSLTSIYYPTQAFDVRVFVLDKKFTLENAVDVQDLVDNSIPHKTYTRILGLEVLGYTDAELFPGVEFPYASFLPVRAAPVSLEISSNGRSAEIGHDMGEYRHKAGIPNIGAADAFPKLEVIGKRVFVLLEGVDEIRNQHGIAIYGGESESETVIIEINPQFSALVHLVESTGILDDMPGKLSMDISQDPTWIAFREVPTHSTISIDWMRHSRAKSDLRITYRFPSESPDAYQSYHEVAGRSIDSNLPFDKSDGSLVFEYRYPAVPKNHAVSIWGDLEYLKLFNVAADVSSNSRTDKVVGDAKSGIFVASDRPWLRHQSLDFHVQGKSLLNVPRGSLFVNGSRFNPIVTFSKSAEGMVAILAAVVSILGFVLTFIPQSISFHGRDDS